MTFVSYEAVVHERQELMQNISSNNQLEVQLINWQTDCISRAMSESQPPLASTLHVFRQSSGAVQAVVLSTGASGALNALQVV